MRIGVIWERDVDFGIALIADYLGLCSARTTCLTRDERPTV